MESIDGAKKKKVFHVCQRVCDGFILGWLPQAFLTRYLNQCEWKSLDKVFPLSIAREFPNDTLQNEVGVEF